MSICELGCNFTKLRHNLLMYLLYNPTILFTYSIVLNLNLTMALFLLPLHISHCCCNILLLYFPYPSEKPTSFTFNSYDIVTYAKKYHNCNILFVMHMLLNYCKFNPWSESPTPSHNPLPLPPSLPRSNYPLLN